MYNTLLERQKEADLARRMKVNNVDVVDEPTEPRAPDPPEHADQPRHRLARRTRRSASRLAVLREQIDSSMKTPEDVETRLNLTFLGMLPSLDEDAPAYGGTAARKGEAPTSSAAAASGDPALYVHDRPLSGVAEAARSFRTNLHFMNPDSRTARSS